MGNLSDYIHWRGDLQFNKDKFNDVDNLVLSQLAYVDFTNIIPSDSSQRRITLARASA